MRTARSTTSGENFGDFLMMAPFSIEGASSKAGAVQPADVQSPETFYVAWGTETNSATPLPLDIWMQRSSDFGAKYEAKRPLSVGGESSEAQLRLTPDGINVQALWMQTLGVVTDVYFRTGVANK
jgi:hypothetical protein